MRWSRSQWPQWPPAKVSPSLGWTERFASAGDRQGGTESFRAFVFLSFWVVESIEVNTFSFCVWPLTCKYRLCWMDLYTSCTWYIIVFLLLQGLRIRVSRTRFLWIVWPGDGGLVRSADLTQVNETVTLQLSNDQPELLGEQREKFQVASGND